jgi:mono/diheme cytochrome c family protein
MLRQLFLLTLLLFSSAACQARADSPAAAQVRRGDRAYARACSECHDPGRIGPVIHRLDLLKYETAADLYDYNRRTMPIQAPGSLPDQSYWDITAYMLARVYYLPPEILLEPATADGVAVQLYPR